MPVRPPAEIKRELLERLRVMAVLIPTFGWISFVYERCTGLTFVISRGGGIGQNSSAAHLHRVLNVAIGLSLLFVPLFLFAHTVLRRRSE